MYQDHDILWTCLLEFDMTYLNTLWRLNAKWQFFQTISSYVVYLNEHCYIISCFLEQLTHGKSNLAVKCIHAEWIVDIRRLLEQLITVGSFVRSFERNAIFCLIPRCNLVYSNLFRVYFSIVGNGMEWNILPRMRSFNNIPMSTVSTNVYQEQLLWGTGEHSQCVLRHGFN